MRKKDIEFVSNTLQTLCQFPFPIAYIIRDFINYLTFHELFYSFMQENNMPPGYEWRAVAEYGCFPKCDPAYHCWYCRTSASHHNDQALANEKDVNSYRRNRKFKRCKGVKSVNQR